MNLSPEKLAAGKRIHELEMLNRLLVYRHGILQILSKSLRDNYGITMDEKTRKNVVNVMTNEFPSGSGKKTYETCVFIQKEGEEYGISRNFARMLGNSEFYQILQGAYRFRHFQVPAEFQPPLPGYGICPLPEIYLRGRLPPAELGEQRSAPEYRRLQIRQEYQDLSGFYQLS